MKACASAVSNVSRLAGNISGPPGQNSMSKSKNRSNATFASGTLNV